VHVKQQPQQPDRQSGHMRVYGVSHRKPRCGKLLIPAPVAFTLELN
jgi:hypothetical protein